MPDFQTRCSSIAVKLIRFSLTVVVELEAGRDLLDREARLEEQQGDALHEFDSVHLVAKERLLEPHAPLKQLLVLEQERQGPNEDVDATFENLSLSVVADHLLLRSEIMHGLNRLKISNLAADLQRTLCRSNCRSSPP